MTHLRKMMLEELQRRNYSENTIRCYIRAVEDFSRRFNCSPDRLGPRHIREYQAELFQKRKLSSGSVAVRLAALRFFYCKTLKKGWNIAETPYPKREHRLPEILSREEVARLIQAAGTAFHRTLLMTLYATGVRNASRFPSSEMFALAPLSPQVSYPAAAVHRIRGALGAQAILELTPPNVDVAQFYSAFRALGFLFVAVHHRWEPTPVFVDYTRFRRTQEAHRACSLRATQRPGAVDEVNVSRCATR